MSIFQDYAQIDTIAKEYKIPTVYEAMLMQSECTSILSENAVFDVLKKIFGFIVGIFKSLFDFIGGIFSKIFGKKSSSYSSSSNSGESEDSDESLPNPHSGALVSNIDSSSNKPASRARDYKPKEKKRSADPADDGLKYIHYISMKNSSELDTYFKTFTAVINPKNVIKYNKACCDGDQTVQRTVSKFFDRLRETLANERQFLQDLSKNYMNGDMGSRDRRYNDALGKSPDSMDLSSIEKSKQSADQKFPNGYKGSEEVEEVINKIPNITFDTIGNVFGVKDVKDEYFKDKERLKELLSDIPKSSREAAELIPSVYGKSSKDIDKTVETMERESEFAVKRGKAGIAKLKTTMDKFISDQQKETKDTYYAQKTATVVNKYASELKSAVEEYVKNTQNAVRSIVPIINECKSSIDRYRKILERCADEYMTLS